MHFGEVSHLREGDSGSQSALALTHQLVRRCARGCLLA